MNNLYLLFLLLMISSSLYTQSVSGTVSDKNGEALIAANILIKGTSIGTVTNLEGKFNLDNTSGFPCILIVSYTGFTTQEIEIRQATSDLQVQLIETGFIGQEIVVSASRKSEKLQEAPAAVSVISAQEVASSGGAVAPIRALINTPGVELQQQTGQRINIALRGNSNIFNTGVFPMLDYRSLITPGLGVFDSQNSPLNNIDVERIEVVLGPGSALYGPDVTTGVVHFISKNPFDHPGTTTELVYGERNTFKSAIRHAGHSENEKFGYKINARYGSGNDFTLNAGNPLDDATLANFNETISRGFVTEGGFIDPQQQGPVLFTTGQKQKQEYWAAAVNGNLHFRPDDETEIVGAGGLNGGSAIYYTDLGEGFNQSGEIWGQARLTHKGLFAQTYYIKNDGGNDAKPTYLNRTGLISPLERSHLEAQVQYNFQTPSFLNAEWTTGIDFRNAKANSENHVFGRNEDNDDYRILGGYIQSELKLGPKWDLFLAGRYDTYNFTDENSFSPRAALVFKPNPSHSLRLTYNRAPNPFDAGVLYYDLPLQSTPIFNVWLYGAINPQTFNDPTITWLIPGVPETPFEAGFPLAAAYAAVNGDVIAGIEALGQQDPDLAPLVPVLVQILENGAPAGFSNNISSTHLNGNELLPVSSPAKLIAYTSYYEFGYRGLLADKLAFGFNMYYRRTPDAGNLAQVSPVVTMTNLPEDLGAGVQSTFQPQVEAALIANGFDPQTAAATAEQIGTLLNGAYSDAGQQFLDALTNAGLPFHGIVESDQMPETGLPNLAFGYTLDNPDRVFKRWGFELSTKYYFNHAFSAFANYTWINRSSGNPGDLNFPQNKIRSGLSYAPETGWNGRIAFQWDQAYTSYITTYPGKIDARSLVDVSVGYGFENGLTLEASATNLLNNKFRALPGLPEIGRLVTGRVTYHFGGN